MYVLNTLAPIFLVVLLGAVLRWRRFASDSVFREVNRLVYWVALPCLMFEKTAQRTTRGAEAMRLFLVLLIATVACGALGYVAGWLLRVPRRSVGALVQGSYRGNLFYVGLAVIQSALAGGTGRLDPALETMAVLALAPLVPFYNITAAVVLLAGQKEAGDAAGRRAGRLLLNVATNPLVLSCVAGIAWSRAVGDLPLVARRTVGAVGQMALPLALFALGASLRLGSLRQTLAPALAGALIKVAAAPAVGYLVGRGMGLDPVGLRMAMLYLACPTAVMSFVMAEQLGGDGALAANIVVLSTLLSVVSFAVVLVV